MKILLTSGTGEGPTKLAAFDSALNCAGVANFNLIKLSSVIPRDSIIHEFNNSLDINDSPGSWGDKLYVVMADNRVDVPMAEAWAGIGWIQGDDGSGLFVEHEGDTAGAVRADIRASLRALVETRDLDWDLGSISMKLSGVKCNNEPVCSLVVARYAAEQWVE